MKKLRKQIKESFFNPILHFLPLLLFLVLDEFYGMNTAWEIAFPIALLLVFYVYYVFNQIFTWHLIFTFLFMGVGLVTSIVYLLPLPFYLQNFEDKVVVLAFILVFLLFKKQIQRTISRIMPRLIPMSNNFNELYRVIWTLFFVLLFFISANLLLKFSENTQTKLYLELLKYIFVGIVIFLIIYEILRVQIIRGKLVREEWWPIVSDQGKIIGSIQYLTSLLDEKKYMHPIVRVLLLERNMIFLQKRSSEDLIFPGLWDTAISNHVRMGENIEQCIDRTVYEHSILNKFKYMYLANYTHETKNELHYAFLFVSCQLAELNPNSTFVENTKWWTQQQIEENLQTGIFSDNFKIEFDLLKRSGLLETGRCECACRLKEVIYQQPNITKKK